MLTLEQIIENGNIVIHTPQKKQAKMLLDILLGKGLTNGSKTAYEIWEMVGLFQTKTRRNTCYHPASGTFGFVEKYLEKGCAVIPFGAIEELSHLMVMLENPSLEDILQDEQTVIHAPTQEKAEKLLHLFHEKGLRWKNGISYLEANCWRAYASETCYKPADGSIGSRDSFEEAGYDIIESDDLLGDAQTEKQLVSVDDVLTDNRTVIHTPTAEKAKKLMQLFDKKGLRWKSGESYLLDDQWATCVHETCYYPSNGTYASKAYWEERGYSIVEADVLLDGAQTEKPFVTLEDVIADKKMAVHTATEEEALFLMKELDNRGSTWAGGDSYLSEKRWNKYGPMTCFFPAEGIYGTLMYAESFGYTILALDEITGLPEPTRCKYTEALNQLTKKLDKDKKGFKFRLEKAIEKANKYNELKAEMERLVKTYR